MTCEHSDNSLPSRSYVIATTSIPQETYSLGNGYTLRPVRYVFPNSIFGDNVFQRKILTMALSEVDYDSLNVYKDLIVFHSFVSDKPISTINPIRFNESPTYIFAETSDKILIDDSYLTFIPENIISNLAVDFNRFPVTTDVNEKMEPITTSINYGSAFWTFSRLKLSRQTRRLYNQIQLWEFSRNFTPLHRIYSNDNIPPSFYVAILDSLLGRPKECKEVISECCKCHRKEIKHEEESWRQRFLIHYGEQFKEHLNTRSGTFHEAEFLDYFEEWDRINSLVGDESQRETERFDRLQFITEELEHLVHVQLLSAFLDKYRSGN